MVGASHQRLHIQQPTPTPLPHPHMPQTIRFKAPGNKHGSTQSPERTTSNGRREAKPTTNTGTMLQQHSFTSTSPQQAQKHTTLTKTMVVPQQTSHTTTKTNTITNRSKHGPVNTTMVGHRSHASTSTEANKAQLKHNNGRRDAKPTTNTETMQTKPS